MSRPPQPDNLSVSLEPHLIEILRPLLDTIPASLSAELSPLLSETTSSSSPIPTIPYTLLLSISRWVRTEEAARALRSKSPPLDPIAYTMVSLLAGTRTSPDKKFPQLSRSSDRSENAARDISDRRAIIAVLNALLSVICTGVATWWAAQRTGWRDEWVGSLYYVCSVRAYPSNLEGSSVAARRNNHCNLRDWTVYHMGISPYGTAANQGQPQPRTTTWRLPCEPRRHP